MQAGGGDTEDGVRHVTSWASGNTKSKERRERYHSYKTGPKAKGDYERYDSNDLCTKDILDIK